MLIELLSNQEQILIEVLFAIIIIMLALTAIVCVVTFVKVIVEILQDRYIDQVDELLTTKVDEIVIQYANRE